MINRLTTPLRRFSRRLAADEDGFAGTPILFIGLFLLLFAGVQGAAFYVGTDVAQNAAQAGYTVARAYQADDQAGVAAADQLVESMHAFLNQPNVTVTRNTAAETVTVTVTARPLSLVPGVTLPAITRSVTGPIERWVPAQ